MELFAWLVDIFTPKEVLGFFTGSGLTVLFYVLTNLRAYQKEREITQEVDNWLLAHLQDFELMFDQLSKNEESLYTTMTRLDQIINEIHMLLRRGPENVLALLAVLLNECTIIKERLAYLQRQEDRRVAVEQEHARRQPQINTPSE